MGFSNFFILRRAWIYIPNHIIFALQKDGSIIIIVCLVFWLLRILAFYKVCVDVCE